MSRNPRQDYEGAWHHLMNRGAARRAVFVDDIDRQDFLKCIASASEKAGIDVHCYCLMENHFHLLVSSRSGLLSDFMRLFAGAYSRRFNQRRKSDGPIFRGRCHSIEVRSDAHLVAASRYIHLNPVTAGLVVDSSDWPWSSAAAYVGHRVCPPWLHVNDLLDMFGDDPRSAYGRYLLDGVDARTARFYGDLQWK